MDYYFWALRIISIGVFFDSLHSIYYYKKYYTDIGIFNLNIIIGKNKFGTIPKLLQLLYPLINEKRFIVVLILRLIISILILTFPYKFSLFVFFLFSIQLLFNLRNTLALSGADQMRTIILFGLSVMSLKNEYFIIGSGFIILQLYISYFFTGLNKINSPTWRKGKALIYVMNSELFGNFYIQDKLIKKGKNLNIFLCWSVIIFQILFPVFASLEYTLFFILLFGIIFHLLLAIISNLNDFFWSYISAYPIVIYFTKNVINNFF